MSFIPIGRGGKAASNRTSSSSIDETWSAHGEKIVEVTGNSQLKIHRGDENDKLAAQAIGNQLGNDLRNRTGQDGLVQLG